MPAMGDTSIPKPPPGGASIPESTGPAAEFEKLLTNSTDAEINQWAVRTFGGDRYRMMVWLLTEVRKLRAEVAELKAGRGR